MAKGDKKAISLTQFLRGGHSDDGRLVQAVFGDDDGNEYVLTAPPEAIDQITMSLQEIKLIALGVAGEGAAPEGAPEGQTSLVQFMPGAGGKHMVMEVRDPKGRIHRFPLDQQGLQSVVQSLKGVREVVQRYRRMKEGAVPDETPENPPDET